MSAHRDEAYRFCLNFDILSSVKSLTVHAENKTQCLRIRSTPELGPTHARRGT